MSPEVHSVAAPLTTGSFTKAGYTFSGWDTAAIGSGIPHFEGRGDRTVDDKLSLFTAPERMRRCKH